MLQPSPEGSVTRSGSNQVSRTARRLRPVVLLGLLAAVAFVPACGSTDGSTPTRFLTAKPKDLAHRHDLYYALDHAATALEIQFSLRVDPASVDGNVCLHHKHGSLAEALRVEVDGDTVSLRLEDGVRLEPGWQYFVSIAEEVQSVFGHPMREDTTLEIRTASANPFPGSASTGAVEPEDRSAIVCISDIHMGEARAVDHGYCWFVENAEALQAFVEMVETKRQFRELVILGDLFDEWLIPFNRPPFDGAVSDSRDYFRAVRNAPTNTAIFDKLADISSGGEIRVVYVRGNHDMLTKNATLHELLPGVVFRGPIRGLGSYHPVHGVAMEHGHRYDFFNCPQPLVNPDHVLPPGYFVSRMWAAGMEAQSDQTGALPADETAEGPFGSDGGLFPLTWDAALIYSEVQFPALTPPSLTDPVILMTGIDEYAAPFSFEGAKAMYVNGGIETQWPDTQAAHEVQAPLPVALSILNGHSDLFAEAQVEYLGKEGRGIRIVVFGHTHEPMLGVYPPGPAHTGIYANTGSWINEVSAGYIGGSAKQVRTFVVYSPAAWTGSDLDVVTLYQYNLANDGNSYEAVKLAEESLSYGGSLASTLFGHR